MKRTFLFLLSVSLFSTGFAQKKYNPTWESIDSRPIPTWFTDAKFGIFIHWGLYAVPAWGPVGKEWPVYSKYAEWYWYRMQSDSSKVGNAFRAFHAKTYGPNFRYQDFANSFKAELFNPDQWADLFAASGAKYVVLTSKHHEGFTLWPSKESWNWNAVDVGPHRDLAGDLTRAVKKKGLHMGFYYSLYEWYNPLYHTNVGRYVDEHMLPQLKDLVTRYSPDVVWPDGEWEHPSSTWKSTDFLAWLYNESPVRETVVVNDRWGKETRSKHGGYYTTEYDLIGDVNSKEIKMAHPWEECRGIGGSFGYNRAETLQEYESSASLVHLLIERVAKGGNLLLDIGPAADGTIPVIMQQRLLDMGRWLQANGEAIYGTQAWSKVPQAKKEATQFFTQKGQDLYVLCTTFPTAPIVVENVGKPSRVSLLGSKAVVQSTAGNGGVTIIPPDLKPGETGEYAWVFKLEGVH
ncbi:alpha-L-fucosidase [Flavisolibacter nicotianae]|uniref:alpha-L-fucosidase n=1 Tax=Flavisolibacter nicotianae TaxID=2364882 RepID=UPI000EB579BB|nr:alpha-L-fucosidase [Flavisolibacter nicotianae]